IATTSQPALVGKGSGYEIFAVRWPAFGDVHGEGLLLVPTGRKKVADVVAIPDADQTPEQIVGLVEGVPAKSQLARRLAEGGRRTRSAAGRSSRRPRGKEARAPGSWPRRGKTSSKRECGRRTGSEAWSGAGRRPRAS